MNECFFIGRLTKDPDFSVNGENMRCTFTLAIQRDRDRENADFINITAFNRLAEIVLNNCKKGSKIMVNANVHNNNYTSKEGTQVYGFDFVAQKIEFLEPKNKE